MRIMQSASSSLTARRQSGSLAIRCEIARNESALYNTQTIMLSAVRDPHTGVDFPWWNLTSACKIRTDCYFLSCFLLSCLSQQQNMLTFCCTLVLMRIDQDFFRACAGFHHTCMCASWMHAKKSYILMCYIHVHFWAPFANLVAPHIRIFLGRTDVCG